MIDITIEDGVAVLTWDMPGRKQNVFNQASIDALVASVEQVVADDAVTGIVFTSAKKDFIAGADLETVEDMCKGGRTAQELHDGAGALSSILRRIETCGKPVVCALNGTALGGGFELALACHHRVVADSARIQLGLPEAQLGLLPGAGGTQRVPRMIGIQKSLPLLLEGKSLDPAKALKTGLVDAVVPADELIAAAKAWLATGPEPTNPWDRKGFSVPGGGMDVATSTQTFMVGTAMFTDKTYGNYPAGLAIMSCVSEGLRLPMDPALEIEKRYFVSLLLDPTAGAMIRTLFLALGRANKLARRPADVPKRTYTKIGVVGAGLMGAGIAYVAARKGLDVVLLDLSQENADKGKAYTAQKQDRAIGRGRSTEEKKQALLDKIHATSDYADLADCQMVVEAVFEKRPVKAAVTKSAEAVIATDAVLGSNTSTLPITGLAEASSRPNNFIGLHFFSPVERMPLVEVIRGEKTSDECLAWSLDFVQAIGKTPIVVNDARGFYTSRVFGTFITEGLVMLAEGIHPALIENAGKRTGMPMAPLALADEVGLGLMVQVGKQTREDLGDAAPDNPSQAILEKIVLGGRTGKRAAAGFYDYTGEGRKTEKRLWSGLAELWPVADVQPAVESLEERFLYTQALEAARCMDQGILLSEEDADVGAVLGWGFAPWTGGPLSYIDRIGAAEFVQTCDALAAQFGERFEAPPLLRKMAAEGTSFYT